MTNQDIRYIERSQRSHLTEIQPREEETSTIVSCRELNLNFARRIVIVRGKRVHLAPKEFALLRHLVISHDLPISHRRLLEAVWGPGYGQKTELLRVVINQLRKKIEPEPAKPKYITTEFCIGYRFVLPAGGRVRTAP